MRVEGHRHGRRAALARHATDALDDLHVAAMQAVEVAERQHGVQPARRARVLWEMDDVHATRGRARPGSSITSNLKLTDRPSYASWTFSGSAAHVSAWGKSWQMWVNHACARAEASDHRERVGDGEMRGMRAVPQRVDHEHLDAFDERPRRRRESRCNRSGRRAIRFGSRRPALLRATAAPA